jgi:DNA-directed RNA polymerase, beta'' subunit/160 kD subunit
MPPSKASVVVSFQVNTASKEDYSAHKVVDPSKLQRGSDTRRMLVSEFGYNPGSVIGNRQECVICGKVGPECCGHPLTLDLSSLNTVFLSEFGVSTIKALTSVICKSCVSVVRDKDGVAHTLDELRHLPKTRYVCNCKDSSPTILTVGEERIAESERIIEWRAGRKRQKKRSHLQLMVQPSEVRDLIAATDLSSLRFNKEYILDLFYNKMILLPTSVHPMNFKRSHGASVDEVTKMVEKYSELIRNVIDKEVEEIRKTQRTLSVSTGDDRYSGTPSHLMVCDQKTGLFRGPGQNKRAKITGRSVLTPNIHGRSSELWLPRFIMSNLQYEYIVSVHNKEWLQAEVGKSVKYLVIPLESSTTNRRCTYKKISKQTMLRLGDIVLKELCDGDYVSFFRNPTLWRHSLISYQVKGWDNYCIGLHETNTQGHNADFDGDEGNISVGADLAARIEMQMMDAAYQLFNGRSGEPIIGIAYNGIVGAYVLSTDDNIGDHTFAKLKGIIEMQDVRHAGSSRFREIIIDESYYRERASEHGIPYKSGRTLISMLLPRTLNYTRGDVVIERGFMLRGQLRSVDVSKGLISTISEIDRWRLPYLFVDRGYAMMSAYISSKALTISALDYVMPGEKRKQIVPDGYKEKLLEVERKVAELELSKVRKTKASAQRIEEVILHEITSLSQTTEKLLLTGDYKKTSGSIISYMSGARGNIGNIVSTVAFVGQMFAGNLRYDPNVPRSSYYAPRHSVSIFDRGFIRNSYAEGLTPEEVMVIANTARLLALNTYLGTPISGQTAKQTTRHQADVRVSDTLSVIDGKGKVLDLLYGCGCDSTMISHRKTSMGTIELPIDPVALLERITLRAMNEAAGTV